MKLDFYGDRADSKKIEETLKKIKEIEGCEEAKAQSTIEDILSRRGSSKDDGRTHLILAGYSSIVFEWIFKNKEFLFEAKRQLH